jgi:uncharacterized protein with FMN-binding domain
MSFQVPALPARKFIDFRGSVYSEKQSSGFSLGKTVRKLSVSAFVISTFLAYVAHERFTGPVRGPSAADPRPPAQPAAAANPPPAVTIQNQPTNPPSVAAQSAPTSPPPTDVPPTATVQGQYKDGQYTGPEVDAFYGLVRVQAIVRNGQISDVQFLEYPTDRRTSQRINAVAVPYLRTEALQAQSANVDIISGATLTSEAFAMSLDQALSTARH